MTTAAPPSEQTPLTKLRDELTSSRAAGVPLFSTAWPRAVRIALRDHHGNGVSRREWIVAMKETQDAWESAFYSRDDPAGWTELPDLMGEYGPAPRRNQLLG